MLGFVRVVPRAHPTLIEWDRENVGLLVMFRDQIPTTKVWQRDSVGFLLLSEPGFPNRNPV